MGVHQAARQGLTWALLALVVGSSGLEDPKRPAGGKGADEPPPPKSRVEIPIPDLPAELDLFQVPDGPRPIDAIRPPDPTPPPPPDDSRSAVPNGIPAKIADPELFAGRDLKPIPPAAFPDDPPPHEGALIDIPYIIEPPDLVVVEVLEALPGRPIQGDHLMRPDGTISLGFYGDVNLRGLSLRQAKAKIVLHLQKFFTDEVLGLREVDPDTGQVLLVAPADTDRVFVDIGAYNSKVYFVQGDVAAPGRLPITGSETVLDALDYSGHLTDTADPGNVRLVRPARGGKPAKVYRIDIEAILERGDAAANLQLLPGDRLVVGRDETVQRTAAISRKMAPLNSALNSILTYAFTMRSLININEPTGTTSGINFTIGGRTVAVGGSRAMSPADIAHRDARLREAVDYLWKVSRPGAQAMGEAEFKEGLLRIIQTPAPRP